MSDQTLAFAGMLQSAELVRQVAAAGVCSQHAAQDSIATIFRTDPETALDVYGGNAGAVRMGLRIAVEVFSGQPSQDAMQALNYAMALARVSQHLSRDQRRQKELGHELELIRPMWEQAADRFDPSIISQLAEAYQRHVSTLAFRITVNGKPEFLKQEEKVCRIRALLLAGLRSAFLWHQMGGRQWRLVFQRKRMLADAEALLRA